MTRLRIILIALMLLTAMALLIPPVRRVFHPLVVRMQGKRTVEDRLQAFAAARQRVRAMCASAGVAYPPAKVVLLGLKQERRLEVYADGRRVATYPILAASGQPGPKLREGDRQVPEGVYPLESLNPNSKFHAALRVGYPNAFDRQHAAADGRTKLGGDIMIHGGSASVGCLAMGDPAAEDLFVLAAEVGIENVTIVLAPCDLRTQPPPAELNTDWRRELYSDLTQRMRLLPLPGGERAGVRGETSSDERR